MKFKITVRKEIAFILLTLILGVLILELGLRAAGFIISYLQEKGDLRTLKKEGEYVIMCLGESTTARAYPPELDRILRNLGLGINFTVIDKGVRGTNSTVILSELEENLDTYNPDMVVVMMGVYDGSYTLYYEDTLEIKTKLFLQGFRTYKLAGLLWERLRRKLRETGMLGGREIICREALKIDPEDVDTYLELGDWYRTHERRVEAGGMYRIAIALDPDRIDGALADKHPEGRSRQESIRAYEEARKTSPEAGKGIAEIYYGLGTRFFNRYEFNKAEEMLQKAIETNPRYAWAYGDLGRLYRVQGKYGKSKMMCEKAIEVDPQDPAAYCQLGLLYEKQGKPLLAEKMYAVALKLETADNFPFSNLLNLYIKQRKFKEVEELCRGLIEAYPDNRMAQNALALCFEMQGKGELAEAYYNRADESGQGDINSATAKNYRRLKEILEKRGVQLVAMQYPMRKVEHLKRFFLNKEGVIFVDNEGIFKEAVGREGYDAIFVDNCAGNFGHCTPKGNRLLAGNIANMILREVFGEELKKNRDE